MLDLRDFHELERQVLSMLQLCLKNKTKRHTDKEQTDGVAEYKANVIQKDCIKLKLF